MSEVVDADDAESESDKTWFADFVRPNRVFILGAGFSAAAGVPLTATLLNDALKKCQNECSGLYSRLERYAETCFPELPTPIDFTKVDFSEFCTYLEYVELSEFGGGQRWSENGSREKIALRFFLAKTLAESTPAPRDVPALYEAFAKQLHPKDLVLTFNWDCLLESALKKVGKQYAYNSFGDNGKIKIAKLHGSVNWRLNPPAKYLGPPRLPWVSMAFTDGMAEREIYYTDTLVDFQNWKSLKAIGEVDPFLVMPGYGKAYDVRFNAQLWYNPGFAFAATHDVYIIGLSLAPDDFFVRSFFLSNLPYLPNISGVPGRKLRIINPDPNARKHYDFVTQYKHVEFIQEKFGMKHIKLMSANQTP